MSKHDAEPELKVALDTGFHGGRRLRRGDTFLSTVGHKGHWFAPADSPDKTVQAALHNEPDLLDKSIPDIIKELPGLSDAELQGLAQNEMNGKTRKGLLAAISDEQANRVGKTAEELEERATDLME
jgi:hypothetical protein